MLKAAVLQELIGVSANIFCFFKKKQMGSAYKQKRSWSKRKERRRNRKKDVNDNTVVGEEERCKRIWLNQKSFNKYKNLLFHFK